jgi:hypothetical protein
MLLAASRLPGLTPETCRSTDLKFCMLFQVDSGSFLGIGSVLVDWRGIKFLYHLSFPQQANVPVTKSFPEKQRGPGGENRCVLSAALLDIS